MNSEKVISNIKKAIKEHLDKNYAYDMLVDFELDVIDWNSLFEYIDKLQQENEQLKDNWNNLREYFNERIEVWNNILSSPFCNFERATKERLIYSQCLEKLEELEKRK